MARLVDGRERLGIRTAAALALVVAGIVRPAAAQDVAPAEPLTITVRPSRVEDAGAAARERLERLVQRREQDAFRLRWICVHCMGRDVNRPLGDRGSASKSGTIDAN